MAFLLGYDIGTSATKAILCDGAGTILGTATSEYPLYQPHPGWSEQEPQDWWLAVIAATRSLLAAHPGTKVSAIGLTGQMHGSVLLGSDAAASGGLAQPLRRALLWNDQRTASECEEIRALAGGTPALISRVGNAALTGFMLPKLLWVRNHEPQLWAQVRHVLCPKDFIAFRLSGKLAADVGDASGTLLFDVDHRCWDTAWCKTLRLNPELLPQVHESASIIGHLTDDAALALGLPEHVPIIIGSGDNQAGAVGAGVVEPGTALSILGTSGVLLAPTDAPRKDLADPAHCGRLHTFCSASGPRGWCMTGCMLSAGLSLRLARDLLCAGTTYESLMQEAATAPAGCDGLIFLPHLTGERCPYPDPAARGGWIGLTSRHTRAHMLRAVIEGITFSMGQIIELARSCGVGIHALRATGGGNRSAFWRQLQADVYGCVLETTTSEDGGGAYGAALLAGAGTGVFNDVAMACRNCVRPSATTQPSGDISPALNESRMIHGAMYAKLKGTWNH
ncbi:MAG: xylulokinase [Planctomycetota bacterium]|nr:xylulokinase [Planctomycetota bacterium]